MKFTLKKKIVAGAAVLALGIGAGGAAFAYWTSTGSGTGSASTGTATNDLVITQTSTNSGMAPGVAAGAITGTIKNTNASQNEHVASVTVSIGTITQTTAGAAAGPCTAGDYTLSNPVMTVNQDLAPGTSANFSGASIGFNNSTTTNQDGCQGATVALAYASN